VVFRQPHSADQTVWGTGSGLNIWNLSVSRETMDLAAAKKSGRSRIEQQVGDYWSACMDEKGIDASALRDLAPEMRDIAAIKNKAGLMDEMAHLHNALPGAWEGGNNQTNSPMFGFGSTQDLDDASLVVISVDQGVWRSPVATSISKRTPSPWKSATSIRPTSAGCSSSPAKAKTPPPEKLKSF